MGHDNANTMTLLLGKLNMRATYVGYFRLCNTVCCLEKVRMLLLIPLRSSPLEMRRGGKWSRARSRAHGHAHCQLSARPSLHSPCSRDMSTRGALKPLFHIGNDCGFRRLLKTKGMNKAKKDGWAGKRMDPGKRLEVILTESCLKCIQRPTAFKEARQDQLRENQVGKADMTWEHSCSPFPCRPQWQYS